MEPDFYQTLRLYLRSQNQSYPGALNPMLEYVFLPPDLLHLTLRLLLDESVPIREKAKVVLAIAYYFSPIDLVPNGLLGPVGLLDDIAVSFYALNSLLNNADPETLERTWAGDKTVLRTVQGFATAVDNHMGGSFLRQLDPVLARLFP